MRASLYFMLSGFNVGNAFLSMTMGKPGWAIGLMGLAVLVYLMGQAFQKEAVNEAIAASKASLT